MLIVFHIIADMLSNKKPELIITSGKLKISPVKIFSKKNYTKFFPLFYYEIPNKQELQQIALHFYGYWCYSCIR